MKQQEVSDILFKEFTEILIKYNVNPEDASFLIAAFGARWHFLPEQHLKPIKELLHKMPLSKHLENEAGLKKLFDQVSEDLRLLISQDAGASDATQ